MGLDVKGRRADVSGQANGEHLMRGASSFAEVKWAVESLGTETRQGKGSPGEMRQVVGDAVGEIAAPCECSSEDFLTWIEELTRSQRQTWDLASSTRSVRTCNAGAVERRVMKGVFSRCCFPPGVHDTTTRLLRQRVSTFTRSHMASTNRMFSMFPGSNLEAACRRVAV